MLNWYYLMSSWLKLKKNNVVNCKYKDMMKVFLSKRHSKPILELKYYKKSGRNPKEIRENISSSFKITLNDGNHRSSLSQMFSNKCFLKNFVMLTGKHCVGVSF